ncbi:leucine-rich repeat domain-containing protein [Clostridium algidicarnis]|uniref:leucine-rich repeat domain-containing protein n=1 Tax=Clostridium algidicarnis TaxID=37659 RepID=UPI001C0C8E54|nr:leucine-rich repeat domain-containing protein [Clostridium algidicarnis]MBU3223291.1 leucine-rich repeat domain-containing protein [Clostridium algidicarnis]
MKSKRLKQIISMTLCAVIISGFGGFNVKANASELKGVDLIYSNAYKATMKAQEDKTQKSINEARLAVDKLKAVLPNSNAIPIWSSLTDKIQHPKLVKIVNSISKAQENKTQKSINEARDTIEDELPSKWKNSYSSALDVVQQFKIDEVVKAVEKAKTTKDAKDIAIASDLITEIKTSNKDFISNFGKTMETKLSESTTPEVIPETKVVFKDKTLEKVVRKIINKPEGEISTEDVSKIITLNAENKGIKDLSGLEQFKNLEILNLDNYYANTVTTGIENEITDIMPLKGLPKLRILQARENKIKDISSLQDLPSITKLDLSSNQIIDVSPLDGLTKLTYLDIRSNKITDISVLEGMSNLTILCVGSNPLEDLSTIYNLTKIEKLYINRLNNVIDFEFLLNYKKIEALDVSSVNLTRKQINTLKQLKTLKSLTVGDGLEDVSALIKELQQALPRCIID